jgi:uncharacterized protein
MKDLSPVDPRRRIEILDVLRGFALLGIIFNNMSYLSGYAFTPFETLKQITDFQADEHLYHLLDIIITAKFYTLFSFLFATGFSIQLARHADEAHDFLSTYRRRLFILLMFGVLHSLIWFGDILLSYAVMGFLLIPFRAVRPKHLLRWAICMLMLPFLIDLAVRPLFQTPTGFSFQVTAPVVHVSYPDMTPDAVIGIFQNGSVRDVFLLNVHNLVWKFLGYFPSGQYFILFGIFLLGYYLASTGFLTDPSRSTVLLITSLGIGLLATVGARIMNGNPYRWPPSLPNTLFKFLLAAGQIALCISYITMLHRVFRTRIGNTLLRYLIPLGRMALTNYLLQTVIMIVIFYNCGFDLFGRIGLIQTTCIAILILVFQIVLSNAWLKRFRFGPCEWLWRSMTYRKWIPLRYDVPQ